MSDNGYNPMRWDCFKQGCFNQVRRPKIEIFAECFPGRISFGDIDGIVEINGKALMLEWKSSDGPLPTGQRIMFERLSKKDISVFVVFGDAESMEVHKLMQFTNGRQGGWENINLDGLKKRISEWAESA